MTRSTLIGTVVAAASIGLAMPAHPQDAADASVMAAPTRPAIMFNRWQEDWSVLANPATPREPFDALKYIPLKASDPGTYLSFGAGVRERFEANDAPDFGVGGSPAENYVISRMEVHADLRIAGQVQVFAQIQSDFAPWKKVLTPVDQDPLGLEQAFVALAEPFAGGELRLRIGRQQIAFDLQRFVSERDGPNIRQSYDAIWAAFDRGPWTVTSFYSQPVQNSDLHVFDDFSNGHLTYGGVRIERRLFGIVKIALSLSRFTQDKVRFPTVFGNERRSVVDVHTSGAASGFDWDLEFMNQTGSIGADRIKAWAFGSLAGYTLRGTPWRPRIGLQIDAASGDANPHDDVLGSFNPLFPNGYYVTLAGYTGYVNFVHVKPSLTLHPAKALTVVAAAAGQWRETTADAVYTQPDIPVANTAGRGGHYTGTYGQLRADWAINPQISAAIEATHFEVGQAIRAAAGHGDDYVGVELKFGW